MSWRFQDVARAGRTQDACIHLHGFSKVPFSVELLEIIDFRRCRGFPLFSRTFGLSEGPRHSAGWHTSEGNLAIPWQVPPLRVWAHQQQPRFCRPVRAALLREVRRTGVDSSGHTGFLLGHAEQGVLFPGQRQDHGLARGLSFFFEGATNQQMILKKRRSGSKCLKVIENQVSLGVNSRCTTHHKVPTSLKLTSTSTGGSRSLVGPGLVRFASLVTSACLFERGVETRRSAKGEEKSGELKGIGPERWEPRT